MTPRELTIELRAAAAEWPGLSPEQIVLLTDAAEKIDSVIGKLAVELLRYDELEERMKIATKAIAEAEQLMHDAQSGKAWEVLLVAQADIERVD